MKVDLNDLDFKELPLYVRQYFFENYKGRELSIKFFQGFFDKSFVKSPGVYYFGTVVSNVNNSEAILSFTLNGFIVKYFASSGLFIYPNLVSPFLFDACSVYGPANFRFTGLKINVL